jgi:hypothetical protein
MQFPPLRTSENRLYFTKEALLFIIFRFNHAIWWIIAVITNGLEDE